MLMPKTSATAAAAATPLEYANSGASPAGGLAGGIPATSSQAEKRMTGSRKATLHANALVSFCKDGSTGRNGSQRAIPNCTAMANKKPACRGVKYATADAREDNQNRRTWCCTNQISSGYGDALMNAK
jgi:hypothetical protein